MSWKRRGEKGIMKRTSARTPQSLQKGLSSDSVCLAGFFQSINESDEFLSCVRERLVVVLALGPLLVEVSLGGWVSVTDVLDGIGRGQNAAHTFRDSSSPQKTCRTGLRRGPLRGVLECHRRFGPERRHRRGSAQRLRPAPQGPYRTPSSCHRSLPPLSYIFQLSAFYH